MPAGKRIRHPGSSAEFSNDIETRYRTQIRIMRIRTFDKLAPFGYNRSEGGEFVFLRAPTVAAHIVRHARRTKPIKNDWRKKKCWN